jgi:hypothetical protein
MYIIYVFYLVHWLVVMMIVLKQSVVFYLVNSCQFLEAN